MNQQTKIVEKPNVFEPIIENIPHELKEYRNWVVWAYKPAAKGSKPWTKIPLMPNSPHMASSSNPRTWHTFVTAAASYEKHKKVLSGVGFMLYPTRIQLVGVDFDNCRDRATGVIEPWAVALIERLDSYTEISPSGTGVRIFVKAQLPSGRCRTSSGPCIEMYMSGRYLTVTGHRIDGTPATIEKRQEEINAIHKELFPQEQVKERSVTAGSVGAEDHDIFEVASKSEKFNKLWAGKWQGDYESQSSADLALTSLLAFYCGPDAREQVDRMFSRSALYRDKWDREDYKQRTLDVAMQRDEFFDWNRGSDLAAAEEAIDAIVGHEFSGDSEPDDFCDFVPEPKPKEKPRAKKRGVILDRDIAKLPDPEPIVDQFIDVESFNNFYGDTNVGKSFVTLDLANSIARGIPFLGYYRTFEAMPVAYIYAEGRRGLKKRLMAWRKHRKQDQSDNLVFAPYRYVINDEAETEVDELLEDCTQALGREPKVLFVDTLAKNMEGDENGSDMSMLVNRLSELITERNLTIIVVHHTGKDRSRGARGSSSLKGGLDSEFEVVRGPDENVIHILNDKARDSKYTNIAVCEKEVIKLGHDKYGREISSLVLNYRSEDRRVKEPELTPKNEMKRLVLSFLTAEPVNCAAIAKEVGTAKSTLNKLLLEMRDAGEIGYTEKAINGGVGFLYYRLAPRNPAQNPAQR